LTFDHGRIDWVVIGEQTIGRTIQEPGWRWSTHIRPIVGGGWCQSRHVGAVISGRMHVVTDDGDEFDVGPYDVIDVAPGHDAWVVGHEPVNQVEWSGVRGWLEPLESLNERVLATVVVTDIVDSTGHATRLGGSVHEAARVAAAAAEGEVLVTAITRDLAAGSGLSSRIEASTSSEGSTVFGEGSPPGERARPWGFP